MLLSFLLLLAAPQYQAQMTQSAGAAYASADAAMTRQWQATYAAMKRRDARDTSRGGGYGLDAADGDRAVPRQADGLPHAATQVADVDAMMLNRLSNAKPTWATAV